MGLFVIAIGFPIKSDYVSALSTKLVEMKLSLLVVDRANFAPLVLGPTKRPSL